MCPPGAASHAGTAQVDAHVCHVASLVRTEQKHRTHTHTHTHTHIGQLDSLESLSHVRLVYNVRICLVPQAAGCLLTRHAMSPAGGVASLARDQQ